MWLAGLFVFLGWMLSLCLHEFGHAIVAYLGGDTSVKDKGYLTLNPLNYTDPGLSLMMPMIFLLMGGIALPGGAVYIDHSRLRNRWWDSAVSAAGPLANAMVTLVLAIPFWLGLATELSTHWFWSSLAFLIFLEIFAVVLNLLPIPPLDGYGIIRPWLPEKIQHRFNQFGKYGIWFIFGLLWFVPAAGRFLWNFVYRIAVILKVPFDTLYEGSLLFDKPQVKLSLIIAFMGFLWLIKRHEDQRKNSPELTLYHQGYQLESDKYYEEAIAAYDQAIEIKPDFYEAWYHQGNSLYQLRRYEEAITSYNRAVYIHPNGSSAWYNLACCYALQGNINQAIKSLEQAIKLEPDLRSRAKTDPDFDRIRENPLFKNLIVKEG
ncbi:MAG TPA: hypothetical protein DCL61_14535 [Cyanobacteria bacterium UBA12227]|nr:hypothetical protein [Cyanobacteria bacterium UBA12227]HAX88005.1 hypothetical protein [Cyanobacteria bacterium UBA11370]HBY78603.1 hypothetical protein [Cyanobacteria bacterium UBA11148]